MIPSLLYPEGYDLSTVTYYSCRNDLIKDFKLAQLCQYMSKKDPYIEQVMLHNMMAPLGDSNLIRYRHEIIKECSQHRDEFQEIYNLCKSCVERTNQYIKENCGRKSVITTRTLVEGIACYQKMMEDMMSIQGILEGLQITSKGMYQLRKQMIAEHSTYPVVELEQLKQDMEAFDGGAQFELYLHLELGTGFKLKNAYIEEIILDDEEKGIRAALRKSAKSVMKSLFHSNQLDLSDASALREMEELKITSLEQIHKIYVNQIRTTLPFFEQLRSEIAFYIGADNFYHVFRLKGLPMCLPEIPIHMEKQMSFQRLYEPVLGYQESGVVVTNDMEQHPVRVTVISGANQGGKSTYLKSIGIAQILFQCGLYVNAESFSSYCYDEIFTHFSRREDKTMTRSRFEEELMRLDEMFHHFTKNSMILMNESFASTTEEEGSQIATDLTHVLYEAGMVMFSVSHLYQYATSLYQEQLPEVHFLNAVRLPDGTRTFKMVEQAPNHTSYGMDLFEQILKI